MDASKPGFQRSQAPQAAGRQSRVGDIAQRLGRRAALILGMALITGSGAGCTAVPVSVGNPIPGMTTVAVAPFFNLSAEPSVDGRRFALAYYSELQKTANYQVIPVGIVEATIRENDLNMSSPADAIKLARILDADAVVVGAVTHYSPYYPPQLGVHVRWFSGRDWLFHPGISTGEEKTIGYPPDDCPPPEGRKPGAPIVRGQSADSAVSGDDRSEPFGPPPTPLKLAQAKSGASGSSSAAPTGPVLWPPGSDLTEPIPNGSPRPPAGDPNGAFCSPLQEDAIQPVMSYTRYFDGADRLLLHQLKGYYALRGDMRSGGWEAYLHRSDDFLQFASFVLVIEMLELHGGPLKTEKVLYYRP